MAGHTRETDLRDFPRITRARNHRPMGKPGRLGIAAIVLFGLLAGPFHNPVHAQSADDAICLSEGPSFQNTSRLETKRTVQAILSNLRDDQYYPELEILQPHDNSVFPRDIASPTFTWEDPYIHSTTWLVRVDLGGRTRPIYVLTDQNSWTPDREVWEIIKANSIEQKAGITILGVAPGRSYEVITRGTMTLSISKDGGDAPIFFLQMPLPFAYAEMHPELSRWVLADLSSYEEPPVVMQNLPTCGNCHNFSSDGRTFGMDMDYQGDKGAYVLAPVSQRIVLTEKDFISWNNFRRSDKTKSMGLFSKISPDGNYVISTVKEKSFFAFINDLDFSQFFFPIRGLIAFYSKKEKAFFPLPGADDPDYVQTCPEWSPDGKFVVFSRAKVDQRLIETIGDKPYLEIGPDVRIEDLNEKYQIRFDLYRIPFNHGKGGRPEPLPGAHHNGKSNYFPRYSPDGRWIVFTQCETGLAIQPESQLHIIPAQGGVARKMRCNTDIMNSWHSWSPNARWLVFSSKIHTPYTELFLTHVDEDGHDTPPVLLSRFKAEKCAALVPEFVALRPGDLKEIRLEGF
jgi:hypothetical protein